MIPIAETDQHFICEIPSPCFQMLSPEEATLVRSSKTQVFFRKGELLTKQGAFASYVLFLIKGLAIQYIESDSSRNFNLRIIGPGSFVGLSAVFTKETFHYSSVALIDCQVLLVEKSAIVEVIQTNGAFGYQMSKRYAEQNAQLFETLGNVLFKQMNGRMAETLLYLNGWKTSFPEIFQLLTRKDIADFAGTSTESAVKLLKSFEKDGCIRLVEKDIELMDEVRLSKISQIG